MFKCRLESLFPPTNPRSSLEVFCSSTLPLFLAHIYYRSPFPNKKK
uniref:Uncharacterized protein n=1 Tax=Rhizophora mucronata TaxID=61149 RepID=A0A2P2QFU5_RHIMU